MLSCDHCGHLHRSQVQAVNRVRSLCPSVLPRTSAHSHLRHCASSWLFPSGRMSSHVRVISPGQVDSYPTVGDTKERQRTKGREVAEDIILMGDSRFYFPVSHSFTHQIHDKLKGNMETQNKAITFGWEEGRFSRTGCISD